VSAIKSSAGPAVFSTKKTSKSSATILVGHRIPTKQGKNAIDARKQRVLAGKRGGR